MSKENVPLTIIIENLLNKQEEIAVHDVAEAANLDQNNERDRKYIRRTLIALVEKGILQKKGDARARIYFLKKSAKKIIPYNTKFLKSYKPNKTFYLSISQRVALKKIGLTENIQRPAGTYAHHILNRLLIDLSWNSSRLEGNTYSLLETQRLIEIGENAEGKDSTETQMILNHKRAIEYIAKTDDTTKITSQEICSIHALLSENLLGDPSASGRLRKIAVKISGTKYAPIDNPHLLKECFDVFLATLNRIQDPFEKSFFTLVHLSYLQAFEDINKRTARLVANIPFIKENLKPLSFTDIETETYVKALLEIYEKNNIAPFRDLYVSAYKKSALQYSAVQESVGGINLIKLKYRKEIQNIVRKIILEKITGKKLPAQIKQLITLQNIPATETLNFFHLLETELMSLHEGNIALYKLSVPEFKKWKKLQGT